MCVKPSGQEHASRRRGAGFAPVQVIGHRLDVADGEQSRDFIYVRDCSAVVLWLLNNPGTSGLFNLGTGKARSIKDLMLAVEALLLGKTVVPSDCRYDPPGSLRDQYQYFTGASHRKYGLSLRLHSTRRLSRAFPFDRGRRAGLCADISDAGRSLSVAPLVIAGGAKQPRRRGGSSLDAFGITESQRGLRHAGTAGVKFGNVTAWRCSLRLAMTAHHSHSPAANSPISRTTSSNRSICGK